MLSCYFEKVAVVSYCLSISASVNKTKLWLKRGWEYLIIAKYSICFTSPITTNNRVICQNVNFGLFSSTNFCISYTFLIIHNLDTWKKGNINVLYISFYVVFLAKQIFKSLNILLPKHTNLLMQFIVTKFFLNMGAIREKQDIHGIFLV